MRYVFGALIILISFSLSGCLDPNTSATTVKLGDSQSLLMGGNLRLVTERKRPVEWGAPALPILCTEPNPDVAIAFGRTLAVQASVPNYGSGSLNAASTETATELAGRTAGVLALRDGLYAACQSYVNGVIGQDAYALILSQYGNLLIALAGTGQSSLPPISPQDAAISALLVACISEYDRTRLGARTRLGYQSTNPLLSRGTCSTLISNIVHGRLLTSSKAQPKKSASNQKLGPVTETVIDTKTTYGPAPAKPAK